MDERAQQELSDYLSGFINETRRRRLEKILQRRTRHITVALEDVYRSQNASAVVRTCECLGVQDLHIIENQYQYQLNPAVVQGASKWVDLIRHNQPGRDNVRACVAALRRHGYRIIAMTPAPGGNALALEQLDVNEKLALCFGSEEPGLSTSLLSLADATARLPIHGFTQSYNLSVSAAISLYTLVTRLKNSAVNWRLDAREAGELRVKWLAQSTPAGPSLLEDYLARQGRRRAKTPGAP